jgi:hypothetical protein
VFVVDDMKAGVVIDCIFFLFCEIPPIYYSRMSVSCCEWKSERKICLYLAAVVSLKCFACELAISESDDGILVKND